MFQIPYRVSSSNYIQYHKVVCGESVQRLTWDGGGGVSPTTTTLVCPPLITFYCVWVLFLLQLWPAPTPERCQRPLAFRSLLQKPPSCHYTSSLPKRDGHTLFQKCSIIRYRMQQALSDTQLCNQQVSSRLTHWAA